MFPLQNILLLMMVAALPSCASGRSDRGHGSPAHWTRVSFVTPPGKLLEVTKNRIGMRVEVFQTNRNYQAYTVEPARKPNERQYTLFWKVSAATKTCFIGLSQRLDCKSLYRDRSSAPYVKRLELNQL